MGELSTGSVVKAFDVFGIALESESPLVDKCKLDLSDIKAIV
jgi:hypothetical protein